mgnify:CR=1 FL=1
MIKNCGDYWKFENAILDAAPMYFISRNGLFILTNDEDLAVNHSDGYGSESLSRKECKAAKKSGFMYGHIDIQETLNRTIIVVSINSGHTTIQIFFQILS